MADRTRDAEDRRLDALFASEPIADDGFSAAVVRRIRRRIWVRRLAMPFALVLGLAISAGPALELVKIGTRLLGSLPAGWIPAPVVSAGQLPVFLVGAALFVVGCLSVKALEE